MTMTKLPMKRGILLLITAGLLALLLYMYYIVGFGNVVSQFEKTNLYYYAAAFLAVLAGITFFSLTWRSLLANLSIKIKVRQALLFVYAGMFIDSLVPEPANITGDLAKAYLVSKVTGESSGKTTASVIGHKTLGIIITVGNLVAGLILLVFNYYLVNEILIFILILLVLLASSLVILYYISTRPQASKRVVYGFIGLLCFILRGRWDLAKLQARADELLDSFHEGVQTLTAKPKALIKPVLLSILSWTFDVSAVFLVFISIGYSVTPDKVLIVYALTGGLQAMGISFIGVTEVITSTLYTILSIPLAVSLTATLLSRFITFWFRLLIAYGAFQYVSLRLLLNQSEIKTEQKTIDSNIS
ncbi:MAG TPA: lysylphosphatidylglycerol synthase transmembrane domain-containing protein [Candidatus Krumholzibacteriaceae bacterium]|nr:lysylphosphatidylglycerol synthase transmembrane domain-containing protein [Candidatus Krumholzibacteriaceae bacterium]